MAYTMDSVGAVAALLYFADKGKFYVLATLIAGIATAYAMSQ